MKFSANVEAFAAERRGIVDSAAEALREVVTNGLILFNDGEEDWDQPIINVLNEIWSAVLAQDEVDPATVPFAPFRQVIEDSLARTTETQGDARDAQIERLSLWLAAAAVNAATTAAANAVEGEFVLLEWVTMQDADVRDLHRPLNGDQVPVGETFRVGESALHYPGEPVGPPEVWINCRCVVRPVLGDEMSARTFAVDPDEDLEDLEDAPMLETDDEFEFEDIEVHGVLAPINVMSGDGRTLTEVTWAETPQALRWVKQDSGYHDGAVRVGTIKDIYEADGLIRWRGTMLHTPEADEAINLMAEGPLGLSVDLDSTTMEVEEDLENPGEMAPMKVTGRIRAATLVDIPAFVEAYAMLGPEPIEEPTEEELVASGCAPCAAAAMNEFYALIVDFAISESAWDGAASRFSDEEWVRSTVVDRGEEFETPKERYAVPILEPNGDLNRAAVHAAAGRINQVEAPDSALSAGRRKIVAAYRRLDEEPPESLTASAFAPGTKDGPGWITHPVPTQRIRNYWTRGAGAAKIRWGQPGDFNRCRTQLRKYIANPQWLAGTCANLHFVALGVWPGRETTRSVEGALMASAFTIYEEEAKVLPADWFVDPELDKPTPVTVTPEGRVFGHIAQWGVCHIGLGLSVGMDDTCTQAPHSASGYAHYRTGVVDTSEGEIPVGNLTMGIGHAPDKASARATLAHYDNVNAVVADVVTGEDEHGIWFSGAMRDLPDEKIRAFKASTLSGDWRRIGGELELVAALAVNVPGFGIPRLSLAASGGHQTALVAAGIVQREESKAELFDIQGTAKALVTAFEEEQKRRTKARAAKAKFRANERKRLASRL